MRGIILLSVLALLGGCAIASELQEKRDEVGGLVAQIAALEGQLAGALDPALRGEIEGKLVQLRKWKADAESEVRKVEAKLVALEGGIDGSVAVLFTLLGLPMLAGGVALGLKKAVIK